MTSSARDQSLYFQLTVPATGDATLVVMSPVDGIMTGFTIRCQATTTDTEVAVSYDGAVVSLTPASAMSTNRTYRYDVESGQLPVVKDGGQTLGNAERLTFTFTNASVQETALFVRVDFISAQ